MSYPAAVVAVTEQIVAVVVPAPEIVAGSDRVCLVGQNAVRYGKQKIGDKGAEGVFGEGPLFIGKEGNAVGSERLFHGKKALRRDEHRDVAVARPLKDVFFDERRDCGELLRLVRGGKTPDLRGAHLGRREFFGGEEPVAEVFRLLDVVALRPLPLRIAARRAELRRRLARVEFGVSPEEDARDGAEGGRRRAHPLEPLFGKGTEAEKDDVFAVLFGGEFFGQEGEIAVFVEEPARDEPLVIFFEEKAQIEEFAPERALRLLRTVFQHVRVHAGSGKLGDRLVHRLRRTGTETFEFPRVFGQKGGDLHDGALLGEHLGPREKAGEGGDLGKKCPAAR